MGLPTIFVAEGEYEQHLGKSRQGQHTGEGAFIIMPPGRGSPPIPPPQPILRCQLTEDLYACSDAAAVLIGFDDAGNLVQGEAIIVSDVMSVVGNVLMALPDAAGDLRIPAGTCLYIYYFADDLAYEPIGEMGSCCQGSGVSPSGQPAECGVPCPPAGCTEIQAFPAGGGCFVYGYCCGSGSGRDDELDTGPWVPYTGANQTVDLNTQTIIAGLGQFSNIAGANTCNVCTGDYALQASGNQGTYIVTVHLCDTNNGVAGVFADGTSGNTVTACNGIWTLIGDGPGGFLISNVNSNPSCVGYFFTCQPLVVGAVTNNSWQVTSYTGYQQTALQITETSADPSGFPAQRVTVNGNTDDGETTLQILSAAGGMGGVDNTYALSCDAPIKLTNQIVAGGAGTLTLGAANAPVTGMPAGWLKISINGSPHYIPYW